MNPFKQNDKSSHDHPDDDVLEDEMSVDDVGEEFPQLIQLGRFARLLEGGSWFSQIGTPLKAPSHDIAAEYVDRLGFPDCHIAPIQDWEEAVSSLESRDFNSPYWEVEEQLATTLAMDLQEDQAMDMELLQMLLTHVNARAGEVVGDAVHQAAIRYGIFDEDLINAATGQAVQACYHAGLVIAAGQDESHPFSLKYRLYEQGRWPLGVMGNSFNIF